MGLHSSPGLVHACEVETSFCKALFPQMVKDADLVDVEIKEKYIKGKDR